jgi:hypothetical protein
MQNTSIVTASPAEGRAVNAGDVIAQMRTRSSRLTQFAAELDQLRKKGSAPISFSSSLRRAWIRPARRRWLSPADHRPDQADEQDAGRPVVRGERHGGGGRKLDVRGGHPVGARVW